MKENLRFYRTRSDADWMDVPKLSGNTSNLDAQTELNLIKFQELEGLRADGIYGQA
ncbi:hypothetical protein [Paenibacillus sp. TY11]|uniref:hypothetical protein n=1 Tax=Paenibacillus sp. TY11 TaxID=3448633 RepID=UPI00403A74FE